MSDQRFLSLISKLAAGSGGSGAGWSVLRLCSRVLIAGLALSRAFGAGPADAGEAKAREVIAAAIQAMGGETYLGVKTSSSYGRYFAFRRGRKAFTHFKDWAATLDPVKSRFQLGKGKRQTVWVYNLELNKGWKLEGESSVEDLPEEDVKDFKKQVNHDLDYILRSRLQEEGLNLYYFPPDQVAGTGELEAVQFLDRTNDSVVIYFDQNSHLPAKIESEFTDKIGIRHKSITEFSNWHWIGGVYAPLRFDTFVDGNLSRQRHLEKLSLNGAISPSLFLEPQVKKKKKK
ncbi:MAG: hypothetical protein ACE5JX_17110 [Acidobacteriota bacterium]